MDADGNRYGPYDIEVAGSDAEALTEDAWFDLFDSVTGVKSGGGLTFTGLTATLAAINMRVHGSFLIRTDPWSDASPPTTGASPRRDMLVARRQRTSGEGESATAGKTFLTVLRGTPASTPADPTYDIDDDEPLWSWQVPGSGGTVVTGVRDLREFIDRRSGTRTPPAMTAYRSANQGIGAGAATGIVALNDAAAGASPGLSLNPATGVITVSERVAGPYDISGALSLIQAGTPASAAPPARLYVAVLLDGVEYRGQDSHTRGSLVGDLLGRTMPTCRVTIPAGGQLSFRYFYDSSAGATIAPGAGITWLSMRRVA